MVLRPWWLKVLWESISEGKRALRACSSETFLCRCWCNINIEEVRAVHLVINDFLVLLSNILFQLVFFAQASVRNLIRLDEIGLINRCFFIQRAFGLASGANLVISFKHHWLLNVVCWILLLVNEGKPRCARLTIGLNFFLFIIMNSIKSSLWNTIKSLWFILIKLSSRSLVFLHLRKALGRIIVEFHFTQTLLIPANVVLLLRSFKLISLLSLAIFCLYISYLLVVGNLLLNGSHTIYRGLYTLHIFLEFNFAAALWWFKFLFTLFAS